MTSTFTEMIVYTISNISQSCEAVHKNNRSFWRDEEIYPVGIKIYKKLASRIVVLRKIRAFLPLSQRVKYYNAVIRPVMSYASVIWSSCNKEQLYRVLKLQKRTARVILYADHQASAIALFNKLSWIPFYEQSRIDKCFIIYKRINRTLPIYLNDHIIINNNRHARNTRYANINIVCPKYRKETEGGRTFSVSAVKLWNSVPLDIRKADSLPCLRTTWLAEFLGSATIASF